MQDGRESLQFPIILGTGHPAVISSISGIPRFFVQRGSEERFLWISSCLMLVEGLLYFYAINQILWNYTTLNLKEIPNFCTLDWFFKQLIDFSAIIPPHITYPKEIPNFHTLDRFFKELIKFSAIITLSNGDTRFSHPYSSLFCFQWKMERGSTAAGPFEHGRSRLEHSHRIEHSHIVIRIRKAHPGHSSYGHGRPRWL